MTRIPNKIIASLFIVFLLSINILNLVTPNREYSEFENRMLAQFPVFKLKYLISGRFTSKLEEYVSDQFAYRDDWVAMKSDIERMTLKTENNGIYFGKEGYLLEKYNKPDEILYKNLDAINTFTKELSQLSTYFLLVPNSVKINQDKLPLFASPYDQLAAIQNIESMLDQKIAFVNVYNTLVDHKDNYLYFKTDHHWTMTGAYYAYEQLLLQLGMAPYGLEEFNKVVVTHDFYGTYYSRAYNKHISPDSIEIYKPAFDVAYRVDYLDENKQSHSLYEFKYLEEKDKYAMFLDGNHALVKIETSVENNKKLLVLKDSYAHSMIPFLANHYEEIHVIDLRYYKLNVKEYIEQHQIEECLFLYNMETFSTDSSITWLKSLI